MKIKQLLDAASWGLRLTPPPRREYESPLKLAAENAQRAVNEALDTLYVTPAQVLAAQLLVSLIEEDGKTPDKAIVAIANAEVRP